MTYSPDVQPYHPLWRAWLDRSEEEAQLIRHGRARRALILGFSMAAAGSPGLMPAYQRYRGPVFESLLLSGWDPADLEPMTYMLSPTLGMISAAMPVRAYSAEIETRLSATATAALEVSPTRHDWLDLLRSPMSIAVAADDFYLRVLRMWTHRLGADLTDRCTVFSGTSVEKCRAAAQWLRPDPAPLVSRGVSRFVDYPASSVAAI